MAGGVAATADAVIIGGGIVGASVACHLATEGFSGRVLVVDPGLTHMRAATPASMGGVRTLYSVPSNLAMARYGLDFYAGFDDALAGEWGRPRARKSLLPTAGWPPRYCSFPDMRAPATALPIGLWHCGQAQP